ncbi:hypothetical protein [Utexia brackfieldae]|uniref:hypothetical protein n=1 Tax=Utexia brackfieldae TaxID=3074108 RepID=UPI00370DB71D
MPQMVALVLVLLILYIGDVISNLSKAWIPSVFVCVVLFLLGYWTFFPKDIIAKAGIPAVVAIMLMYLLITNMGTLLLMTDLKKQWKTILISLAGIGGIIVSCYLIGLTLFDYNTVVVAIPPLVGGIVSALIMSGGAKAAGLIELSVFAIVIYVMQGFAGFPLTAIVLKKEGLRVLALHRQGDWQSTTTQENANHALEQVISPEETPMPKLFAQFPARYNTAYCQFLRLAVVGMLAYIVSELLKPLVPISPFVLCLLFGIIATSAGFLERHALKKANGFGFAVMGLMLFVFDGLNYATPSMLVNLFVPLVVLIISAVMGMFMFSVIMGKILGVTKSLAFAIALTALYGFPADYIITNEVINNLTKDQHERLILTNHLLPPMLIGGFISVTMVSVVLAGIMVGMIIPVSA